MKAFITSLILYSFLIQGNASHIIGGESYYNCLGNNRYEIVFKMYRYCVTDGAEFDDPLSFSVFDAVTNQRINDYYIFGLSETEESEDLSDGTCDGAPISTCVQTGIYRKTITLTPNSNGYTIAYQRCCRGDDVVNLVNPGGTGLTITSTIPPSNINCNNGPRFNEKPPVLICGTGERAFDQSVTDPDGDSIVYSLCSAFQGATELDPQPNPIPNPPYNQVIWGGGFGATDVFGVSATSSIDQNGVLVLGNANQGKYKLCICIDEYRNGQLLATYKRDFLVTVTNCEYKPQALIDAAPAINNVCGNLSMIFENSSLNANEYLWDFGVPTATSTQLEPTFTYPGFGTYTVTLTANPNATCPDVSEITFTLRDSVNIELQPKQDQCIGAGSYSYSIDGYIDTNFTNVTWNITNDYTPLNTGNHSLSNLTFTSTGIKIIEVIEANGVCADTARDTIEIFDTLQYQNINVTGGACSGDSVFFSVEAENYTSLLWTLNPNDLSYNNESNSEYLLEGSYELIFDISLIGPCAASASDTFDILIYPTPNANITVSPDSVSALYASITLTDESTDNIYFELFTDEGTSSAISPFTYFYPRSGNYNPYTVAVNEYGCKDTAYADLIISPYPRYFAPNAFTPGDGLNATFEFQIYDYQIESFTLHNRWGDAIYSSTDIANVVWDGTYRGKPCPMGVYVWHARLIDEDGKKVDLFGHVTLIR